MSELIRVPDIGNGQGEVIELLVKVGDKVEADQSLLTLESDKASMEIPSPKAGVVKSLKVKVGDTLKEGDEILELEVEGAAQTVASAPAPAEAPKPTPAPAAPAAAPPPTTGGVQTVKVPDIGNGQGEIIELMVKVGDRITADQSLLTLESDKASMEIPSPAAGVVKALKVKIGDTLKEGDEILELEVEGGAQPAAAPPCTRARRGAQADTCSGGSGGSTAAHHWRRADGEGAGHRQWPGRDHRADGQGRRPHHSRPEPADPGVGQGEHGDPLPGCRRR
ncbi:Dihydrolipoyllysine-residue acetyltransferase component of pyruvate dehydrogenase complex [Pseudomonas knackmussii B13]|uniref:Dihydrolipoyllysine-residue acetyltransferase component of pyruvate dehydrogenase complex n=1 Tax=Pseudomonas knackmussii (strain DSM 6978 / CCUG 54928 / LMG 23759 / B13) TaxID=1301098 RepID=A0A024HGG9_PSEKB|nr:Dihydrolipoyllysine-residue acetyltransferase component of pyruvate dehydrogenase complex [Pseudomonas knackmussii B13]